MSRRPPSPSSTSFSGVSNYRSESYRPLRDRVDPTPKIPEILDSRQVARRHYEELQQFLASHLAKGTSVDLIRYGESSEVISSYRTPELTIERKGEAHPLNQATISGAIDRCLR